MTISPTSPISPISPTPLTPEQIRTALDFHGHSCPGLAFGLRVAEWVLTHMGSAADEEIVAIAETDMCAVDAIQALVGCTCGKGNLLFRPYGKVAFSFYRRSDGKSVRLVQNPQFRKPAPAAQAGVSPSAHEQAEDRVKARAALVERIMNAPFAEVFHEKPVQEPMPCQARIMETVICARCGEGVMESRLRRRKGAWLCEPCMAASE